MIFSMKRGKSLGLLKSCLELSCCSVALSCASLCDPMECSMPGFSVLHHLPQFAQIHVHCVGDAIQPSHPFWSPSPPGLNLSQDQVFCFVLFFESAMGVQGVMYGVKESEVQKKNETGTLQEQITFNKVRRGSSQISELLH